MIRLEHRWRKRVRMQRVLNTLQARDHGAARLEVTGEPRDAILVPHPQLDHQGVQFHNNILPRNQQLDSATQRLLVEERERGKACTPGVSFFPPLEMYLAQPLSSSIVFLRHNSTQHHTLGW